MIRDRFSALGRALRHRNYRLFFAGQLISLIGTWMQIVAQSWLVYRLTGSAELLGLVGFASQGPVFLLAQVGGAVADHHDRRRILIATQAVAMALAAVLAALTLSGQVQVWHIFVLAAALGTVNAFDVPTRQAFVVEMVGREDLQNAIALNSSMFNVARLLGPAAAGIAVAAVGEGWCFAFNAFSFLAVIAGLLAMRLPEAAARPAGAPILERMRQGFAYAARTRPIRMLLLLVALMSVVGMPYTVLMPIFANRILGGGPERLGALMSAAGLGALAGALALAARRGLAGLGTAIMRAALGFGAALIAFAMSRSFPLSLVLLLVVGFCQMTQMAAANTLVQSMLPDAYRGRVMAVYAMMFLGMAPFGALLAGLAAGAFGAPATVAAGGSLCILGGLTFARVLPAFRAEARMLVRQNGAATR